MAESAKEVWDRIVERTKQEAAKERANWEKGDKEDKFGNKVSVDSNGNYVYTSKSGAKVTTSYSPNETVRKGGDGRDSFHPIIQAAADNRNVGLYTSSVGGRYLTTPEHDARYLGFNPMGMDYTRRHMNPWEFADAYSREMAGENVDWDKEAWAGQYSPVPSALRQLQDYYKSQGLTHHGYQTTPQMGQYDAWLQQLLPILTGGFGGGNQYGGYYGGGYDGSGINPGGMYGPIYGGGQMYAGGTPNFDETTGQYRNPNPTGGYNYGGINPGGMYGPLYGGGYGGFGGFGGFGGYYNNFDPTYALLSIFGPTLFGSYY